jgi:N-acetylglucosaminyl-diphospho-decaprenol L-rhamnosyltransferase
MTGSSPLDPNGDVSVGIVLFRTPEMIQECLASFDLHRPSRVGELIVIDNSADGSSSALRETFPWIDYVENAENVHFRQGCNQAAARARHPYLLFLNPDTYLEGPDAIAKLAEVLDADPTVGIVGPMLRGDDGKLAPQGAPLAGLRHLLVDATGLRRFTPQTLRRRARHEAAYVPTVTAAALLCRREDFLAVGGFDERSRMYWEEHELARKFAARGLRAYYRPDAFIFHRWRKGGSALNPEIASYFEESSRNYYAAFFGQRGRIAYGGLEFARRVAHALLRSAKR